MKQRVRLTRRNDEGKIIVEECWLLSEGDEVYHGDWYLGAESIRTFMDTGRVIFEDDEGVFGLYPTYVLYIDVL